MSGFVSPGAAGGLPLQVRPDKRAQEEFWHGEAHFQPPVIYDRLIPEESDYGMGFVNPWWPYAGNLLSGAFGDGDGQILNYAPWWQEPWVRSGCNSRLGFVGYTRDAYGSPLGGCTVKCFRTSSDELVSTVTSDATGFYIATTPYIDGHYLVVQKPNAVPPVAGASLNTITPA